MIRGIESRVSVFVASLCLGLWTNTSLADHHDYSKAKDHFERALEAYRNEDFALGLSHFRESHRYGRTWMAGLIVGMHYAQESDPYSAFDAVSGSKVSEEHAELLEAWEAIYEWSLPAGIADDSFCSYRQNDSMGYAACPLNNEQEFDALVDKYFGTWGGILVRQPSEEDKLKLALCPDFKKKRCEAAIIFGEYEFPDPPDLVAPTLEELENFYTNFWSAD